MRTTVKPALEKMLILKNLIHLDQYIAHPRICVRRLAVHMLLAIGFTVPYVSAAEQAHWSYSGPDGPAHWGELSEDYASCRVGKNQSPIDITHSERISLQPLILDYQGKTTELVNNGHTLQLSVDDDNRLLVEGQEFKLIQFHFHSPSEHELSGEAFPLEAHFVHQNDQGELAVVAVMFRQGLENAKLARIGHIAPEHEGSSKPYQTEVTSIASVPEIKSYYRYSGSLTTPPCTEGVRWYVHPSAGTVSAQQVAYFVSLIGKSARGPQPINARIVLNVN